MSACQTCTRDLKDGGLYLDASERSVSDFQKAGWKTCPRCSALAKAHVFLAFPDAFGWRVVHGKRIPQSDCTFHRNNSKEDVVNTSGTRRTCGPAQPARAPAVARSPVVRPPPRRDATPPIPPAEVPLSSEQLDALVLAQVGWLQLSEEGRKVLRTHLDTERKAGNRHAILRLRSTQGPLTCDACRVSLAERYGRDHAEVVELHHLQPLARGVQKPKGIDDFALLCPTCHRIVHYRREEPLKIEEVRRLLAAGS